MHTNELRVQPVGVLQTNCYVLPLSDTRCVVFDPGAEPDKLQDLIGGLDVAAILLTHAHSDHIGAVNDIKRVSDAPVYLHPADLSLATSIRIDYEIADGESIRVDDVAITAIHTPGHTAGMISFLLPDNQAIVGDTLFEGGPGKTWSAEDFRTTVETLRLILEWPDEMVCYPGHGPSFRLGDLRARIQAFVERGHPADFYGDAEW